MVKTPKVDVKAKTPLKAEQKMTKKGPPGPPPLPVTPGELLKGKLKTKK